MGQVNEEFSRAVYAAGFAGMWLFMIFCFYLYLKEDEDAAILLAGNLMSCGMYGKAAARKKEREKAKRARMTENELHDQLEQQQMLEDAFARVARPKILLINFQLFSQFETAEIVRWPKMLADYMDSFQSANLDILKIAAFDCIMRTDFFFGFIFTLVFPFGCLLFLAFVETWGYSVYHAKLRRYPKRCLECGQYTTHIRAPYFHMGGGSSKMVDDIHDELATDGHLDGGNGTAAGGSAKLGANKKKSSAKIVPGSTADHHRRLTHSATAKVTRVHSVVTFASRHDKCPTAQRVSGKDFDAVLRHNVCSFRQRILKRLNYATYQNKTLKAFFWMLLLSYTPVTGKLLRLYKCIEIGDKWVLQADTREECDVGGQWGLFALMGGVPAMIVFVLGIPVLFFVVLYRARAGGVSQLINIVCRAKPGTAAHGLKRRLLERAQVDTEARLKLWVKPTNSKEERNALQYFLKRSNMQSNKNVARLGFVYDTYSEECWWYELVELSRRLSVNVSLHFLAPGSVLQIMLTLGLCVVYLAIHDTYDPYPGWGDAMLGAFAHTQLCVTLFFGLMIKVDSPWLLDMPNYRFYQGQVISWVVILMHVSMISFGVLSVFYEKMTVYKRWREKQTRRKRHRHIVHIIGRHRMVDPAEMALTSLLKDVSKLDSAVEAGGDGLAAARKAGQKRERELQSLHDTQEAHAAITTELQSLSEEFVALQEDVRLGRMTPEEMAKRAAALKRRGEELQLQAVEEAIYASDSSEDNEGKQKKDKGHKEKRAEMRASRQAVLASASKGTAAAAAAAAAEGEPEATRGRKRSSGGKARKKDKKREKKRKTKGSKSKK